MPSGCKAAQDILGYSCDICSIHIELNLDVDDEIFSANVQSRFEKIMKSDCREFTNEDYTKRTSLIAKFFQYLAYWMVRILYYLSTFYFKQKE